MGRPLGKAVKLEERRTQAVKMVKKGDLSQAEVARRMKVDARTVRKWLEWDRGRGKRRLASRPTPGRPSRLSERDRKRLETLLLKGPRTAGYSTDLWSCPRVAELIRRKFGIKYHVDHIVRLLRKMGWSPQRPERRAIEKDDKRIRGWKRRTWPRIKKKPKQSEPQ